MPSHAHANTATPYIKFQQRPERFVNTGRGGMVTTASASRGGVVKKAAAPIDNPVQLSIYKGFCVGISASVDKLKSYICIPSMPRKDIAVITIKLDIHFINQAASFLSVSLLI